MSISNVILDELNHAGIVPYQLELRTGELRISIDPAEIPAVTDCLKNRLGGRPELILAEDTRGDGMGFTLRHLFEIPDHDVIIIVTSVLSAGELSFPSIATRWFLASRFEREIHDLFGLLPDGNPDLRRLSLHQFWPDGYHPLRKDASAPAPFQDDGTPFPFQRVKGEGTYEITVGPIHAGIIEPGHFRFSVDGETVVNLESRLFFLHKGIEKLFETMPFNRGVQLAERISGDSSVAHALAFCMAIERCAAVEVSGRAGHIRVALQELERLYNHIADIGAICTDTGFSVANSHAMRIREDVLRLNESLTGHRLLRGVIQAGGVAVNFSGKQVSDAIREVERIRHDFNGVVAMALDSTLLLDRIQGTGVLANRTARELQVVGVAGRASGIDADVRRDHPYAAYGTMNFRVPVFNEGDVWARMMVRIEEVRESVNLIVQALESMSGGKLLDPVSPPAGFAAFGLVEGWRGPIWHWIVMGRNGMLTRVKIKDPSFANWSALNYAILNNIVPDFPLCSKSFNLSYAGNDL